MIVGKMIRVRLKRFFAEQKLWVLIGKVLEFGENWVTVEGKGIVLLKGRPQPAVVDRETRQIMIPRENIAQIRILPDDFDLSDIRIEMEDLKVLVKVDGAPDTCIGEWGGD
jgi:hypothetical protein